MTGIDAIARQDILSSYKLGETGNVAGMKSKIGSCKNPIQAFACMAAYFAGEQETVMTQKLDEYETQHEVYKDCLAYSKEAHQGKASCPDKKKCSYSTKDFNAYMDRITDNKYSSKMDYKHDGKHKKEEWQGFADVINQQKDMESTELNKLSTEMDMAIKDSSEAEQMATNAVKKATDLMSTQGKTSGG
jgi:hypothetical protein